MKISDALVKLRDDIATEVFALPVREYYAQSNGIRFIGPFLTAYTLHKEALRAITRVNGRVRLRPCHRIRYIHPLPDGLLLVSDCICFLLSQYAKSPSRPVSAALIGLFLDLGEYAGTDWLLEKPADQLDEWKWVGEISGVAAVLLGLTGSAKAQKLLYAYLRTLGEDASFISLLSLMGVTNRKVSGDLLGLLAEMLDQDESWQNAANTFIDIGPSGYNATAEDKLLETIFRTENSRYYQAARALKAMGTTQMTEISKTLEIWLDPNRADINHRSRALDILAGLGANALTPRLIQCLELMLEASSMEELDWFRFAARSLRPEIATPRIVNHLRSLIQDRSYKKSETAAVTLMMIEPSAFPREHISWFIFGIDTRQMDHHPTSLRDEIQVLLDNTMDAELLELAIMDHHPTSLRDEIQVLLDNTMDAELLELAMRRLEQLDGPIGGGDITGSEISDIIRAMGKAAGLPEVLARLDSLFERNPHLWAHTVGRMGRIAITPNYIRWVVEHGRKRAWDDLLFHFEASDIQNLPRVLVGRDIDSIMTPLSDNLEPFSRFFVTDVQHDSPTSSVTLSVDIYSWQDLSECHLPALK